MIVYCTVLAPCVSSYAAFAAYKRFGRRPKPWRRGGFADPERSDTEGGAALLGGETQKERHLLKADVFLFGAVEQSKSEPVFASSSADFRSSKVMVSVPSL